MARDAALEAVLRDIDETAKRPTSSFEAGWEAGKAGWLGGFGSIGAALGLDTQDFANRMREEAAFYSQNAPGVTQFTDVRGLDDLGSALAFGIGQSAPYALELAGGAALGGIPTAFRAAGTAAARQLAPGMIAREAAELAARRGVAREGLTSAAEANLLDAAARGIGTRFAAGTGAAAAGYPSALGDILGSQYEEAGQYDLGAAAPLAAAYDALNFLGGEGALLRAATGPRAVQSALRRPLTAAATVGGIAAKEGLSETGQEVLNQLGRMSVSPEATLTSGGAPGRYLESFLAGGALGGLMGGPVALMEKQVSPEQVAAAPQAGQFRDALDRLAKGEPSELGRREEARTEQQYTEYLTEKAYDDYLAGVARQKAQAELEADYDALGVAADRLARSSADARSREEAAPSEAAFRAVAGQREDLQARREQRAERLGGLEQTFAAQLGLFPGMDVPVAEPTAAPEAAPTPRDTLTGDLFDPFRMLTAPLANVPRAEEAAQTFGAQQSAGQSLVDIGTQLVRGIDPQASRRAVQNRLELLAAANPAEREQLLAKYQEAAKDGVGSRADVAIGDALPQLTQLFPDVLVAPQEEARAAAQQAAQEAETQRRLVAVQSQIAAQEAKAARDRQIQAERDAGLFRLTPGPEGEVRPEAAPEAPTFEAGPVRPEKQRKFDFRTMPAAPTVTAPPRAPKELPPATSAAQAVQRALTETAAPAAPVAQATQREEVIREAVPAQLGRQEEVAQADETEQRQEADALQVLTPEQPAVAEAAPAKPARKPRAAKPKGEPRALQVERAEEVPVRKGARRGEAVPERDTQGQEVARARQAEISQEVAPQPEAAPPEGEITRGTETPEAVQEQPAAPEQARTEGTPAAVSAKPSGLLSGWGDLFDENESVGGKPLGDRSMIAHLAEGNATVENTLQMVADSSQNRMFRDVAKRLLALGVAKNLDLVSDLRYVESTKVPGQRRHGLYSDGKITLHTPSIQVFLHEAVHGATATMLNRALELMKRPAKSLTKEERRLVDAAVRLDGLRAEVALRLGDMSGKLYGLTNVKEFVAEAQTNELFQRILAETPSSADPFAPSLWRKVVRFLADLVGWPKGETDVFARFLEALPAVESAEVDRSVPMLEGKGLESVGDIAPEEDTKRFLQGITPVAKIAPAKDNAFGLRSALAQSFKSLSFDPIKGFAKDPARVRQAKREMAEALDRVWSYVGTQAYGARHSFGRTVAINEVQNMNQYIQSITSRMNRFMSPLIESKLNDAQKANVAAMLGASDLVKLPSQSAAFLKSRLEAFRKGDAPLYEVNPDTGELTVDEKLAAMGIFTPEEFAAGIKVPNSALNYGTNEPGVIKIPGLTATSPEYQAYLAATKAVQNAAAERLHGRIEALADVMTSAFDRSLPKGMSKQDATAVAARSLADKLRRAHEKAYLANSEIDPESKVALSLNDDAVKAADRVAELAHGLFRNKLDAAQLTELAKLTNLTEAELKAGAEAAGKLFDTKGANRLRDALKEDARLKKAESEEALYAIQSIAGGYIPKTRDGRFMLRSRFVDATTGEEVKPVAELQGVLPLVRNDSTAELAALKKEWDAVYDKVGEFEIEALNDEGKKEVRKVRIANASDRDIAAAGEDEGALAEAGIIEADRGAHSSDRLDYLTMMRSIDNLGVAKGELGAELKVELIKKLTDSSSAIRRTLQRKGVPGFDTDFATTVSQYLHGQAWNIGMQRYAPKLEAILQDKAAYWGDGAAEIRNAEQALAEAQKANNKDLTRLRERELAQTKQLFEGHNPQQIETNRAAAREHINFVLSRGGQEEELWTKLRSGVTVMQLGASIASSLTNLTSLPVAALPMLATYNSKTGFGGGFGAKASFEALAKAAKTLAPNMGKTVAQMWQQKVYLPETYFADAIEQARKSKDGKFRGYDAQTWQFIYKATVDGALQAQRYNAMMGKARQTAYSGAWDQVSHRMMAMFAATEEMNRTATALASYELFRKQGMDAGLSAEEAGRVAEEQAIRMVDATQGQYSAANRPKLFRDGPLSILYMYKTFSITMLELLKNLPPEGRAMMLGAVWFMAGSQGLPLWEELTAILDTIAQKLGIGLGITKGNAELAFRKWLNSIHPALDEVVLKGAVDAALGTEIGGRAGIKVGVPLLAMGRAGTDASREFEKLLGPVVGAGKSVLTTAGDLARGDFEKALRDQPVTGLKNLTEAWTYAKYDNVTNKKGQVIMKDPTPVDILARALGYYPTEVKGYQDVVKLGNYSKAYAQELMGALVQDYREARLAGDREEMQEVMQAWRDHQAEFGKSELSLAGFPSRIKKDAVNAEKDLMERNLKSLPKAMQPVFKELAE